MLDLIIIGAGPAGITAAVYAARKNLHTLVITGDIGGQATWSGDIENYTGYQFITGPELALKFQEHMAAFKIKVQMPEIVTDLKRQGKLFTITTDKAQYTSKSVIIATGKRSRELGVEGEKEFKNKGVTYCATCDGPLFRDKNVAIIGAGNSGLDAALQMMNISPKVFVINREESVRGDAIMFDKIRQAPNVTVWDNTAVKRIYGQEFVTGIEVIKHDRSYTLDVKGVFIEIGLIPNSEFATLSERNQWKEIVVDCYNRTNIEGMFAAGDVTNVPEKQIIIACGEGSKASLAVFKYLARSPL